VTSDSLVIVVATSSLMVKTCWIKYPCKGDRVVATANVTLSLLRLHRTNEVMLKIGEKQAINIQYVDGTGYSFVIAVVMLLIMIHRNFKETRNTK